MDAAMADSVKRGLWPYMCLILATLCWAGNFVLGRAVQNDIPPVALNFWRWSTASLFLLPFTWRPIWHHRRIIRRHIKILALLAVTGVSAFNTLVYISLHSTTSINAALMIATVPLLVPALSFVINRMAMSPVQAAGTLLSLAGAVVLITKGDMDRVMRIEFVQGDLLMLAAALIWSVYTVLLTRRPKEISGLVFLNVIAMMGTALLLPFYAAERLSGACFSLTLPNGAAVLYVALFATIAAFAAWNHAVARIGPNRSGLFIHCLPLFTAVLAVVLLGEGLYGYHLIGALLVGLGIYLCSVRPSGRTEGTRN